MCDQGYTPTFDSRKCKIRENNSRRLVATATRRPSNIYVLKPQKISKEERDHKNEVLLSAICLGGSARKKIVTFCH
jgi:hypothetical protein